MNTSNLTLLSLALGAILILFAVNIATHLTPDSAVAPLVGNLAIEKGDIRGMSIESKGKMFTLNEKQQEDALSFINRMRPVEKKDFPNKSRFDFLRIIIYRFDKPEISLLPITFSEQNLVFDVPALNNSAYYLEMSAGEFYSLILKATQE